MYQFVLLVIFFYNIGSEFTELIATRPITIHEFQATGMDC